MHVLCSPFGEGPLKYLPFRVNCRSVDPKHKFILNKCTDVVDLSVTAKVVFLVNVSMITLERK